MKLTILGGGGFRVPLVHEALAHGAPITELVLHDVDAGRLAAIAAVLAGRPGPPVRVTTDLADALAGARFVFSAIRVGGLAGRTVDERVALDLGVLGQETTGPGGIAYGLRTIPVALDIARTVAAVAPDAWVINFTNPAGMITEAMLQVLGERVVGICDSPIGLAARAARALGVGGAARLGGTSEAPAVRAGAGVDAAQELEVAGATSGPVRTRAGADGVVPSAAGAPSAGLPYADYVGLNHLGWLRGLHVDGVDLLPRLLADDAALATIEEARLVGPEWVRALGALPNEYLYYFYRTREAVAAVRAEPATRGEFLHVQQERFYAEAAADPAGAWPAWQRVRAERDATYMAESRAEAGAGERDEVDVATGGYQQVAVALMTALSGGPARTMILDVRNGTAVPGLPPEAVVEVPCLVGPHGVTPLVTRPLPGAMLGLLQQMKAVEQDTIAAARTGSASLALRAFATHPLVDSVEVARQLLRGYRERSPGVAAVLGSP